LRNSKRKKSLKYQLKLKGLSSPSGTIPLIALKEVCDLLLGAAERGLRLAVEGASVKRGRLPAWLTNSLELTVTGLKKGSTVLNIEAPVLGETAKEQIRQQDLWYVAPEPQDTALTLLSKSVRDTTSEAIDSNAYDRGVLDSLLQFKPFLKNNAAKIQFEVRDASRGTFPNWRAGTNKN
jgi:hypothetical protein